MDDGQRNRSLRPAQREIGVFLRCTLENQAAGDRESPGHRPGEIHEQAVRQKAPLRMAADQVVGNRIDLRELGHRLTDEGWALAVSSGKTLSNAPADIIYI